MLNDRSSILALLTSRRSAKPREIVGTGPSDEELEQILAIAARVPDHGALAPWRFVTVSAGQRRDLGELLLAALSETEREPSAAHLDKERQFAAYGGRLVVLVSAPVPDHKIPVWEQELSCGAAGMNLLLASHAMGYVAGWVTGWRAYSERVRKAFCGPGERIAGFIFIGRPGREIEERARPPLAATWTPWTPPAKP